MVGERGRCAARVQKVQKVHRVQRVVVSPPLAAMSIKPTLRDSLLCHQCCKTKCLSLLPLEEGGAAGDG